jgi:four helix bundle protein
MLRPLTADRRPRKDKMTYKFENLEVWQLSLEYIDFIYQLADTLPRKEEFNLKSQIIRAATSISLNIAEGSTSCSDGDQARYIRTAIGSLIETVACLHLIRRRDYMVDKTILKDIYHKSEILFRKLQSFRKSLK